MQADPHHPSSKRQVKQQRQRQRQLNNGFIFNLRIMREFRFTPFVYHSQKYLKKIMYCQGQISKEFLKIGRRSSRSIILSNTAAFSCCCFVKNGKEMNIENSINRLNGKIMNSQTSAKQTKVQPSLKYENI